MVQYGVGLSLHIPVWWSKQGVNDSLSVLTFTNALNATSQF